MTKTLRRLIDAVRVADDNAGRTHLKVMRNEYTPADAYRCRDGMVRQEYRVIPVTLWAEVEAALAEIEK